jgi:hypothetical protein
MLSGSFIIRKCILSSKHTETLSEVSKLLIPFAVFLYRISIFTLRHSARKGNCRFDLLMVELL